MRSHWPIGLLVLALAACGSEPDSEPPPAAPAAETAAAGDQTANLAQMPRWEAAREAGVDFRGVGQEPGWMLDIYGDGRITLLWDYGESIAHFPPTLPDTQQEGATRYVLQTESHSLNITIRRAPCEDAMSGEPYPSTVEVVIDGRTLDGCGRSV